MSKPTIILATSNGVGMGHLARASAVAIELKKIANPVIVSVAGGVAEIPDFMGIPCEYIPGKNRGWMPRSKWDKYFRSRLVAIANETNAKVISFDGVVPYPGFIATKFYRKELKLVWVRRGLWQKNVLRFVLPIQSRLMDAVIEPGDFAREYDNGPTSAMKDATLSSPVTLYSKVRAIEKVQAKKLLGLDIEKPAVLVQLGTGDSDMNQKLTAALNGLVGWKDLQIVLTKDPIASDGTSLVPSGLHVKIVRYFPLADVLAAFDAAICATGYNSVHELLPAGIPTVLVSNIRGTDDQEKRAMWCHDHGFALRADQSDLHDITSTVMQLQSPECRTSLTENCKSLPEADGAREIAEMLFTIATTDEKPRQSFGTSILRFLVIEGLHLTSYIYRLIKPHAMSKGPATTEVIYSSATKASELRDLVKGNVRFEHLMTNGSEKYVQERKKIAQEFYSLS